MLQFLTNHGYAVLVVNNRRSDGYGKTLFNMDKRNHGDKDFKDCVWGKKWLQTINFINKEKIGIMGASYGGYMTMAALAFHPDGFSVGVNIYGVTNWLRTLKSTPAHWEAEKKALFDDMGDPYDEVEAKRLGNISPLFHAKNIKKLTMALQGANDTRVLQNESDETVAEIKKNNIPVEYLIFQDEGHGFVKKNTYHFCIIWFIIS